MYGTRIRPGRRSRLIGGIESELGLISGSGKWIVWLKTMGTPPASGERYWAVTDACGDLVRGVAGVDPGVQQHGVTVLKPEKPADALERDRAELRLFRGVHRGQPLLALEVHEQALDPEGFDRGDRGFPEQSLGVGFGPDGAEVARQLVGQRGDGLSFGRAARDGIAKRDPVLGRIKARLGGHGQALIERGVQPCEVARVQVMGEKLERGQGGVFRWRGRWVLAPGRDEKRGQFRAPGEGVGAKGAVAADVRWGGPGGGGEGDADDDEDA